jgi:uncharacterized membrane protein YeaQ/YmgE (transglycosylase-associated protein family)
MSGVGLLGAIVIGIFAGWIAERIMNRNHGILTNLVVGVVGSLIGGWLAGVFGMTDAYGFWANLVTATVGAVILLFLLGLLKR